MKLASSAGCSFFLELLGVFASDGANSSVLSLRFFLDDFVLDDSDSATLLFDSFGVFNTFSSPTSSLAFFLDDFFSLFASIISFLAFFAGVLPTSSSSSFAPSLSSCFCFFKALASGLAAANSFLFFLPSTLLSPSPLLSLFAPSSLAPPASNLISSNSSNVLLYTGNATELVVLIEMDLMLAHLRGTLSGAAVQMARMLEWRLEGGMDVFPALTVTQVPPLKHIVVAFKILSTLNGNPSSPLVTQIGTGCLFFSKNLLPSAFVNIGKIRSSARNKSYLERSSRR
mmetsp:Transcript_22260/g.48332  ORF Transcript_22260/g.48332 Transcript_22260/m.48332 type:complete len:285 (+) Transcript_22260:541-1395(+)